MMIKEIITSSKVDRYLKVHQLNDFFIKAVKKLVAGQNAGLDFKKREPKSCNVWSFRINKKYRALSIKEENTLFVYRIDDHQ